MGASSGPHPDPSKAAPCPTPANAVRALAFTRSNDTLSVIGETSSLTPGRERGFKRRSRCPLPSRERVGVRGSDQSPITNLYSLPGFPSPAAYACDLSAIHIRVQLSGRHVHVSAFGRSENTSSVLGDSSSLIQDGRGTDSISTPIRTLLRHRFR